MLHMRHRKVKALREGHPARTSGSAHLTVSYDRPKGSFPDRGMTFLQRKVICPIRDLKPWAADQLWLVDRWELLKNGSSLPSQKGCEEALKTQNPSLVAETKGEQLGCQLLYPNQAPTSSFS